MRQTSALLKIRSAPLCVYVHRDWLWKLNGEL